MTTGLVQMEGRGAVTALIDRASKAEGANRAEYFYQAGMMAEIWGGEPGWALELYLKALWLVPGHAAATGAVLRLVDDPAGHAASALEAEQLLEVGGGRHRADLLCARAERRFVAGDLDGARSDLERVLQMQVGHRRARLVLRDVLRLLADHRALAANEKALAQSVADPGHRAVLFALAGQLEEDFGDDPVQAGTDLRFALEAGPKSVWLDGAAERCARRSGDHESLAVRLEDEVTRRTEPRSKLASAIDAAFVNACHLDREAKGLDILTRVIREIDDVVDEAKDSLEAVIAREMAIVLARPSKRLDLLRDLGRRVSSPDRKASIFTQIAQLVLGFDRGETREVDEGVAIRYLKAALEAKPGYRPAIQTLEEVYADLEMGAEASELVLEHSEHEGRPDRLIATARAYGGATDRRDEVTALLRRAIDQSDPVDLFGPDSALDLLVASAVRVGDRDGARKAIYQALTRTRTPRLRRRLLQRLTRYLDEGTVEHLKALVAAFDADPTDFACGHRAAGALRVRGDWQGVAELRSRQIVALEASDAERVADTAVELGQIYGMVLGDPKAALEWYERAAAERPMDEAVRVGIERSLVQLQDWDGLVGHYLARMEALERGDIPGDGDDAATLAYRVALVSEQWLGAFDQAELYYAKVLTSDPNHLPSMTGLVRVTEAKQDWAGLSELLAELAAREGDDVVAAALNFELGELHEDILADLPAAARAYRKALDLDGGLEPAAMGLVRTLFRVSAVSEAVAFVLDKASGAQHPDDRLDLLSAAALLDPTQEEISQGLLAEFPEYLPGVAAELRLGVESGDLSRASAAASRLASGIPVGPIQAVLKRLASLLDRLQRDGLHVDEGGSTDRDGVGEEALLRLEASLRSVGDLEGMATLAEQRAKACPDSLARASYLLAYGRFLQARGHNEGAVGVYEAVLAERPGYLPALKALKLVQEITNDREGLAVTCEREGSQVQDVELAVHDFLSAGTIRRRFLGDVDGAVFDLETVLKLQPSNKTAFESLREIYSVRGDSRSLYHLLARRAGALDDVDECKELLLKMAEIAFSRLKDHKLAVQCHKQVVELDPCHIQSYRILAEIYEGEERWEDAVDSLVGVLGLTEDRHLLALTYKSIAELYEQHLGDLPRAVEAYRSLLRNNPNDLGTQRRLAKILHKLERWEEAAKSYGSLLQRERRRDSLKEDLLALSEICLVGLGDPIRAEQCLAQAVKLDPYDIEVHNAAYLQYRGQGHETKLAEHYLASVRTISATVVERLYEGEAEVAVPLEGLFDLATLYRDPDRTFVASALALHLDVASDAAAAFHRSHAKRLARRTASNPIPVGMTDVTIPTALSASLLTVLRHTEPMVRRLFAASLKPYGVGRRTRLGDRDGRPGASTALLWPRLFSVSECVVHVSQSGPVVPVTEHSEPPSLVLATDGLPKIAEADASYLFMMGRALAPFSMGIGAWIRLPLDLFVALLASVIRVWVPDYASGDERCRDPRVDGDKVAKILGKLGEAPISGAVYELSGTLDATGLLEQRHVLHMAFTRLAAVPIVDPKPILDLVSREGGREAVADLAILLLGDRYTNLRSAVGVALNEM